MSLLHQITARITAMVGASPGEPINALAALEFIAKRVVTMHGANLALLADREAYRALLCGIAWDMGATGGQLDPATFVVLEWPPEPEKPKEEKKLVEVPKGLVSLH